MASQVDAGHFRTEAGSALVNGVVVGNYSGAEGALHAHEFALALRFAV
jgi:hypothetical protein